MLTTIPTDKLPCIVQTDSNTPNHKPTTITPERTQTSQPLPRGNVTELHQTTLFSEKPDIA